jgi:hemolysin activation/secretion protein
MAVATAHATPGHTAVTSDSEEQRLQTQKAQQERQHLQQSPQVRLPEGVGAAEADNRTLPAETPCFDVKRIRLQTPPPPALAWTQDYLSQYDGRCIGQEGLNLIVKRLSNRLIQRGYITTRIAIPPQNLAGGELQLRLTPGTLHAIRINGTAPASLWKSAFPMKPGDLLNLRDIEQGLEQMKRVPSQDVDINIVPGEAPGESDLVLSVKQTKSWRIQLSLDDSGSSATGRLQGALNLSYDNLLNLNDLLTLGLNTDVQNGGGQYGTKGNSLTYSVPWGNWTVALSGSSYHYHQTIHGAVQDFLSSGDSATSELKLQRLLRRDQTSKTSLQLRLSKRYSKSYIEDVEIVNQRRNTTAAEAGLIHRHTLGAAQLDLMFAHREGVPWFGGQQDTDGQPPGSPTYRYRLQTLDISLSVPFKLGSQPVRWLGALRAQTTNDTLYGAEYFAIGNRWTVRGFDGDQTLSADRGWYLRNDLELPLGQTGQTLYLGLDHGQVSGPGTAWLSGQRLSGAVIGLRGGGKGFTYDLFVSSPVQKPAGFPASAATGFQLAYQY